TLSLLKRLRPRPPQGGRRVDMFRVEEMNKQDCLWAFRFTSDELLKLCEVLQIPDPFKTARGHRFSVLEALCMLCARFRHADDQYTLSTQYMCSQAALSEVTNKLSNWLDERWDHLRDWDESFLMHFSKLREYMNMFKKFGVPSSSVCGCIDCTIKQTCKPTWFQELAYTGYKKYHGMKFQAITIPNGLIAHLVGHF
ncbi:hypothetical protein M422DRAFT_171917, partial [Sphaerobolus stellatus SS14]